MATESATQPQPQKSQSKRSNYVKDFEEGLVYLFQYPRMKAFPNLSPFCLKLESWLRFADIKYKNVENLSFMHRSSEGIASLDANLTPEQQAVSVAFERLIENSLFLGSAKFRYEHIDEILASWPSKFGFAQPLFNMFVKKMMTSKIQEKLMATGLGRHPVDEILNVVYGDLQALNNQLGQKPYLMGDKPTKIDASAFAALALILYLKIDTAPKQHIIEKLPNLLKYADNIKEKYWPDWNEFTP